MYDLSSKFNTFYRTHVVLPQTEQDSLYAKKDLNVNRLKDGLKEYNSENNTSYSIEEVFVQGSVAMSTVVQNDNNDYDIDVAIVFGKDSLGDKGPLAVRNIVANALRRKTKQFTSPPIVKTSCVRITYAEGYHIDFAIYRRYYDYDCNCWRYEHAGDKWTKRELKGITDWFQGQNIASEKKLRKIVRLSKMFCNSRTSWKNMPSGLLQTVLCDEQLHTEYERIDELFYYTMKSIITRLDSDKTVSAPVDNSRDLTPRQTDIKKMTNWRNRLNSKLEDLEVLFRDDCTETDAIQAWYGFFNHDYWKQEVSENNQFTQMSATNSVRPFSDNEDFIEDLYPVNLKYSCKVSCHVSGDGFAPTPILRYIELFKHYLPHNFGIRCEMVDSNCPKPYDIYWKVKNVGPEAERRNMLRGQIEKKGYVIKEHTNFFGNHYIECYIIKNGTCVARKRVEIPIGRK